MSDNREIQMARKKVRKTRKRSKVKTYSGSPEVELEQELQILNQELQILYQRIADINDKLYDIRLKEMKKEEARVRIQQARTTVKVECDSCDGTGEIWTGGADILSDPPEKDVCDGYDGCGGTGYKLAKKFVGKPA